MWWTFIPHPTVLLLDEPLGALDPMIRAELQTELREIFQRLKKTVLMVTHDMAEAAYFADAMVLLEDGEIVLEGRQEEFVRASRDSFAGKFVYAQQHLWDLWRA